MAARVRIYIPQAYLVAGRSAMDFMEMVLQQMRAMAVTMASTGPYATGALASTIEIQGPILQGTRVGGAVGSRAPNALVIHDGARVHSIFPKGAQRLYWFGSSRRPQLRFFWRRAGRIVTAPHIPMSPHTVGFSHPGMAGKRYLEIPLQVVGRVHGFSVTTRDTGRI
jgi:hypothetical protein